MAPWFPTLPELSRAEAKTWLWWLAWQASDGGFKLLAGEFELAYHNVACGFSSQQLKDFSKMILPEGRRGYVRLVLNSRYARGLILLAAILRSTKDDQAEGA